MNEHGIYKNLKSQMKHLAPGVEVIREDSKLSYGKPDVFIYYGGRCVAVEIKATTKLTNANYPLRQRKMNMAWDKLVPTYLLCCDEVDSVVYYYVRCNDIFNGIVLNLTNLHSFSLKILTHLIGEKI